MPPDIPAYSFHDCQMPLSDGVGRTNDDAPIFFIQARTFVEDRLSLDTILTFIRSERITQDDTDLRDFSLTVAQKVSAQTVNHIMNAGTIALRSAYTNDLIQMNPADGLRKFTVRAKKRDLLSTAETQALFNLV